MECMEFMSITQELSPLGEKSIVSVDSIVAVVVQESMCDRRTLLEPSGDGRAVIMTHTRGNFLDFRNSEYLSLVILFPVRESFNMKGVDLGSRKRRHTVDLNLE